MALLPYLGEEALYKEFRLDEPWDSLHNKKLLKKLPASSESAQSFQPQQDDRPGLHRRQRPVFTPKKGIAKADIAGPAILLVAAKSDNAVYWTKPADLAYADKQPCRSCSGSTAITR